MHFHECDLGSATRGRPTWSGLLQLSLVGIPVKAYAAVRSNEVSHFHMLHAGCGQRLRYLKHCPTHGNVASEEVARGYEYAKGKHLVVDPAELERLRPERDRALRLERFLDPGAIDPVLFAGRSLYLLPDGNAAGHAYHVLLDVMTRRGQWALGQVVLSSSRHLIAVRPTGSLLTLHVLHYPEFLHARPAEPAPGKPTTPEESRLAELVLDAVSGAVDWHAYRDQRADDIRKLIEAKMAGQPIERDEPARDLLPLLEALKQSVAQADKPETRCESSAPRKPTRKPRRTSA